MLDPKMAALPPHEFWNALYTTIRTSSSGTPSKLLVRFSEPLKPGRALELGCAHGDDALWLAERGWQVTGVDISDTVVARAEKNAQACGLSHRARFERHDLSQTFPDGEFDLISALYLQSPVDFPRAAVLRRAARRVAPGGLLLIVSHATVAPWSWADPDAHIPTPQEALDELALNFDEWSPQFVDNVERLAKGPDGQQAVVQDTVLAISRKRRDRSATAMMG